ncbi:MAG TPA: chemotaxis protein CheA, partial [Desulfosalsimonadaceae bacterium]|nr:chemotaxis protein CheA [Desulfosalsimonadaceae bacterium]
MDEAEIQKQLLEAFHTEARERLENLFSGLAGLEDSQEADERAVFLDSVFREAHSLKGAARSVDLAGIESLCQEMENVFAAMKAGALAPSPGMLDLLHTAAGLVEKSCGEEGQSGEIAAELEAMISSLANSKEEDPSAAAAGESPAAAGTSPARAETEEAFETGEQHSESPQKEPESAAPGEDQQRVRPAAQSVRISADKLDALLLKTEELIPVKHATAEHGQRLAELLQTIEKWQQHWEAFQGDYRRLKEPAAAQDSIDRTLRFIDQTRQTITEFQKQVKKTASIFEAHTRHFRAMVDELLREAKNTSLMPFSTLFSAFPRMVREIARGCGKSVDLQISGEEVEVDKRILEGIKDPLMHLLRNAVDHGIETPALRTERGKPEKGTIRVAASQPESNQIRLEISDDGGGIDARAVKENALGKGTIQQNDAGRLSDEQALNLIFRSGVSSSPEITEISGRGLGMPIVREGVENLGGLISVTSTPGRGSTFIIQLPVTLATFRGVLIETAGRQFILPNAHVRHSLQIRGEDVRTAEGQRFISFHGDPLSLTDLAALLAIDRPYGEDCRDERSSFPVLILDDGSRQMAVSVDAIRQEQEVLVKSLGRQLKKVRHITGATILGNGKAVPILHVSDLIRS